MTPHTPAEYVAQLDLPTLLDSYETWTIMCHGSVHIDTLADSQEWLSACRHEIIRRCAEENFVDGRER